MTSESDKMLDEIKRAKEILSSKEIKPEITIYNAAVTLSTTWKLKGQKVSQLPRAGPWRRYASQNEAPRKEGQLQWPMVSTR
mmetsp:Transcript_85887/g.148713  ORF Transcript_85887/g.148713 Transcript_85887/m.148713 type:complete len:82 (-) Transcript_85887:118-363(-)